MIPLFNKMRANRKHWPKEGIRLLKIDHLAMAKSIAIGSVWALPEVPGAPLDKLKIVSIDEARGTFVYYTGSSGPKVQFTGTISRLFKKATRIS